MYAVTVTFFVDYKTPDGAEEKVREVIQYGNSNLIYQPEYEVAEVEEINEQR